MKAKKQDKAGAPIGNKNAEVWTIDEARDLYAKAMSLAKNKMNYTVQGKSVNGFEYDFIGEVADDLEIYHTLLSRHLPGRFKECEPLWERLKGRLERNCYSNTKKGIIKEAVGIINLKSNHGWKDRVEQDVNHSGTVALKDPFKQIRENAEIEDKPE